MNAKSGLFLALLSLGLVAMPDKGFAADDAEEGNDETSESEASKEKPVEKPEVSKIEAVPSAGYGHHGYYLSDGDANTLQIKGRLQVRGQYTNLDLGESRAHSHQFLLARARLFLMGTAFTKRLSYKVQTHFDRGDVGLRDFYLDYRVGEGETRVRMGQFKMAFSRQFIQSAGILEFVDRSIVNNYIGNGRDIGLQLHNGIDLLPATEWSVGVFNGTGDTSTFTPTTVVDPVTMESEIVNGSFSNVPNKIRPAVALRIGHNNEAMRAETYSESDMTNAGFRYSVGAAVLTHFRYGAGAASTRAGVDFLVKSEGISASGGIFADMQGPKVADLSYAGIAAYAQAGYMLNDTKQLALLYATIAKDGGDNEQEVSMAFTHFEFGHNVKWQADVTLLHTDYGVKRQDIRARSQIQLDF